MAGMELQNYGTGHEMSNQQSVKPRSSPTQTSKKLVSGPFWTLLAGGCTKVVILTQLPVAIEMCAQIGQTTNTAWKITCGTLAVRLQQWHPCEWQHWDGSQAKQIFACWLASNSTNMPLAMKCQINNGGYLQLRSFTFFALHDLYSRPS